jgi:outer membrane protein
MIRRTLRAVIVLTLFATVSSALAQIKVGYISSDAILEKSEDAKTAKEKLLKLQAAWEQEGTNRQKEIKSLGDQIDKQSLLLSAERKKELEDSLQQKYTQYQKFMQDKFSEKGEWYSKNTELMKPISEKVQRIIDKIAKEENFDFIFDARAGGIIYALPKYDLTDRVLMLLNKEK